jgi:two-component system, cell cycle sensor histidine kinase and response regulator CckA
MALPEKWPQNPRSHPVRSSQPNRDYFRAIVENAPEILALIAADGTLRYTNPHLGRVLGYRSEDIHGRNIFEFIHPEDVPRATEEYADTLEHRGERIPSVIRVRSALGEWVPFEIIACNRLHDPNIEAVVFTARDRRFYSDIEDVIRNINADRTTPAPDRVTELARMNAALRVEVQARYQAEVHLQHTISLLNATLDSTADGILVVSNERKVTGCNKKFLDMWNLSCDSSIGTDDEVLLASVTETLQSPGEFLDKVRSLYADPSVTSFDVLRLSDGRIFERYSQPQRIGETVIGRVWSFRDVTNARNLELQLHQSQKMEALGRLAGGIAHDFNNLLMLVSGYVRQLLDTSLPSTERGTCEQILATTNRGASVIRQLLAFSRKRPDQTTVADLNAIVLNMERMLHRLLSDQVELQITVAAEPVPINIDVSQLEMLIVNLATNAQDAMPRGGLLSISTISNASLWKQDKDHPTDVPYALLQVTDTGHGMTPEVQARIFEPFFTTKEIGRGTGLGLATAFGVVERAGGYIEVSSAPEHGSIFRVYLPTTAVPLAISDQLPPTIPVMSEGETILLAEDEAGIRAMTKQYLESLQYHVIEAADGADAVRVSQEYSGTIHLFLSDILMPKMRGDMSFAELQKQRPLIKVIFMTGFSDHDIGSSAHPIMNKPFEFPELGRRIRSVLSEGTPPSANEAGVRNPQ